MRTRTVLLAVVLTVLALTTGCAKVEQALTPEPTVVTEEATVAAAAAPVLGDLPSDAPSDVPLWPESTVVESEVTKDSYGLTMITTDSYDDVVAGLAKGFGDAGWTVEKDESEEGGRVTVLTVTTDAYDGFVTITEIDDGTVQLDYALAFTE